MNKGYWFDGYFYEKWKILCGICGNDMGHSDRESGELSYCGCEEGLEVLNG